MQYVQALHPHQQPCIQEGPSSLGFEMRPGAASPLDPLSVPVTRALPRPGSSISNPAAVPAVTSAPLHAGANGNTDQMPSMSYEERSHAPELGDLKDTRDWKALCAETVRIPVITPAGFIETDTTESDAESETDSETEPESEETTESDICEDPGLEEYSGSESESTSTDSYEESTEEESTEEEEEEDAVDPFYDDEEEEGDFEDDHSTGLVLDADYITERDAVDRLTESLNQSLLGFQGEHQVFSIRIPRDAYSAQNLSIPASPLCLLAGRQSLCTLHDTCSLCGLYRQKSTAHIFGRLCVCHR